MNSMNVAELPLEVNKRCLKGTYTNVKVNFTAWNSGSNTSHSLATAQRLIASIKNWKNCVVPQDRRWTLRLCSQVTTFFLNIPPPEDAAVKRQRQENMCLDRVLTHSKLSMNTAGSTRTSWASNQNETSQAQLLHSPGLLHVTQSYCSILDDEGEVILSNKNKQDCCV